LNFWFHFLAIVLVGEAGYGSGNVFARNPATGIYGPVCDDFWDTNDVSKFLWHKIKCESVIV
jgi:hypothetical protein